MAMLIDAGDAAQADFFQRHLSPWALRFMQDLARVESPFYAGVGALGEAFLAREDAQLRLAPDTQVVTFSPSAASSDDEAGDS